MTAKRFKFTQEQKDKIKEAIQDLESHSSGEIVPFFTFRSDSYEEARWKSAVLLGVGGAIMLALAAYFWLLPFAITPLEDAIYIIVLMLLGYFIPILFPGSIRFFLNEDTLYQRVVHHAETVFLEEEIFNTRDRTGILIYISELEHQVVILADKGISAKVTPNDWEVITGIVIEGIKSKKVDEGLVNAISACKNLLLENGFKVRSDDKNELDDDLKIR